MLSSKKGSVFGQDRQCFRGKTGSVFERERLPFLAVSPAGDELAGLAAGLGGVVDDVVALEADLR